MSSSLLHKQYPASLDQLIWIACAIGGKWLYKCPSIDGLFFELKSWTNLYFTFMHLTSLLSELSVNSRADSVL